MDDVWRLLAADRQDRQDNGEVMAGRSDRAAERDGEEVATRRRRHADGLQDRRAGGRGGRRSSDRGRPWWQKGLVFGVLCVVLRCWRFLGRRAKR